MQRRRERLCDNVLGGEICEHRTFVLESFDLRSMLKAKSETARASISAVVINIALTPKLGTSAGNP